MTRRITGAEARELVEAATSGPWEHSGASVRVRGAPSVGALAVAAYGHPEENAALIAAAPDLARTVIALEEERAEAMSAYLAMTAERDALRTRLALHEAFVSALDAHEEAVHALHDATPTTFGEAYAARASAWERAHAAREALREAAK